MHIHQMSVSYLAEQDRVLMRINTTDGQEMRLWLTRRLMVGLWPLLSRLLTDHLLRLESAGASLSSADRELKKMLADFRKEEFLRGADFDTPYKEAHEPAKLPLGEEPLLVTDVDATPLPGGPLRLAFNERLSGGAAPRNFQIELEPKLMQGLMHLLEQSLIQSGWRDPFSGQRVAAEEAAASEDDTSPRRPRYLN